MGARFLSGQKPQGCHRQQAAELQQKMALAQAQAEAQALQAEAMLAFLEAQLESGIEE